MEFKAEIKKTFTGPDKLRAVCSVVLDDCFLVKNVRVVEGEKGLFVSLPSRRNVKGEWVEHCFPMTKELRAERGNCCVLITAPHIPIPIGGGRAPPPERRWLLIGIYLSAADRGPAEWSNRLH